MHARAVATPLVDLEEWEAAINVIDAGIRGLEEFLGDYGQENQADRLGELQYLRRWRKDVVTKSGGGGEDDDESLDPVEQVRSQLEEAIAEERYEEAADLRDQLRRLEDPQPPQLP
nr:UvrB/UvrC motif-containing protein [Aeoliella straminimaris]